VFFFDAGSVVVSSEVDGIHLDKELHAVLGLAVAETLGEILNLKNGLGKSIDGIRKR